VPTMMGLSEAPGEVAWRGKLRQYELALPADRASARRALHADHLGSGNARFAGWIGPFVALGARVSRYAARLSERQLIVAVSVPRRDFAAALIGCGWVMNSEPPHLDSPVSVLQQLQPGTPVRIVTEHEVLLARFLSLERTPVASLVRLSGGLAWSVSKIRAISAAPEFDDRPVRIPRPRLGDIGTLAPLEATWDERLARPAADLVIVGTETWLREEVEAYLSRDSGKSGESCRISDLLLPMGPRVATWSTRLYPAARFAARLPLPADVRTVILDGTGAIRYLPEVETQVAICIIDRSVADDTAAEAIIQLRNVRGEPLSVCDDLRWAPPLGVEALAFTVAL
jgi:hypothetical protein